MTARSLGSERVTLALIETTRRLIESAPDYKEASTEERRRLFTETYTALKNPVLEEDRKFVELLEELREIGQTPDE